jgi:hypothetical protein
MEFPDLQPWLALSRQTVAWGQAALESAALVLDPRPLRTAWVKSLSQAMDGYLRSPLFLEMMGQALRIMARAPLPRSTLTPR